MGAGEEGTPAKSSKPASTVQEAQGTPTAPAPAYPDWASSMQAFYGGGATPPFFASTVGSPTPHPFMWGGQHPLMPPYGTPIPYPAMYPPGGVYAHPNMVRAPVNVHASELDGRATEGGKDRASSKKNKGNSVNHGLVSGKTGDGGKATSGSGNDVGTQSAESGSEGSSDASDDENQDFSGNKKGSFDQMLADGANAQNNGIPANFQPGNTVASVPATNLNIGMDLWNASPAGAVHPNQPTVAPAGAMNEHWVQDERELKKQKRKQSNRESARRSRLRKQAECEELQQRVEVLNNENRTLRDELRKLSEECEKVTSENNSIKEELSRFSGQDDVGNKSSETHKSQ
ncbi:hypothetical protein ACP275_08G076100 [Erythranthe tilingii]